LREISEEHISVTYLILMEVDLSLSHFIWANLYSQRLMEKPGEPPLLHRPEAASADSDPEFQSACDDADLVFRPHSLGFLPHPWKDDPITFGKLVESFFRRKCSSQTRFLHKLYNALRISEIDPSYFNIVGVEWVTDRVIRVNKVKFARLLGIRTPDGSLFHQQGNFPSHGFAEISPFEARANISPSHLDGVDFENVRLFVHRSGDFFRGCGPEIEAKCHWQNRRRNDR
jgi:hypothetical protein